MQSIRKRANRYGSVLGKIVVLGVLAGSVAGCVAYPAGYRAYPDDTYYDDGYPQSYYYPESSVTLDLGGDDHRGPDWHGGGHGGHDDGDRGGHWR